MASQGGSDVIPVTYSYTTASTVWIPQDQDQQGYYINRCVASVSFGKFQVTGNTSMYLRHIALYGTVSMQITRSNLGSQQAPVYVQVIADGVQYDVQQGPPVIVPANVKYLISLSGDYAAI